MTHRRMTILMPLISIFFLLAACVTATDPTLPHDALPVITVATDVELIASPAHPTSYLPFDAIKTGDTVSLIGADEDAAWLLVLYDDRLGWMPTIYAATNLATVTPPITFAMPDAQCTKYLDATSFSESMWISPQAGGVTVVGTVYRPRAIVDFDDTTLRVDSDGNATVVDSDYVHTVLTNETSLVLFTYSLSNVERGDRISFELDIESVDEAIFQTAFFENSCLTDQSYLPIGALRLPNAEVQEPTTTALANLEQTALVPAAAVIRRTSIPPPATVIGDEELVCNVLPKERCLPSDFLTLDAVGILGQLGGQTSWAQVEQGDPTILFHDGTVTAQACEQ